LAGQQIRGPNQSRIVHANRFKNIIIIIKFKKYKIVEIDVAYIRFLVLNYFLNYYFNILIIFF